MRIFVNNVDGFLAGAVCADLWKLSHHIVGTRKGRQDDLIPPMVKRIVPRVEVRRLLKAVAACDVVVYDLHDADLEELELVLRSLQVSELHHRMTFILISSAGVWARTQRGYEEIPVEVEAPVGSDEAEAEGEGEGGEGAEGAGAAEEAGEGDGEAAGAPPADLGPPAMRPAVLNSQDYIRRVPAPKFQEWKAIETQVLSLKSKGGGQVRPYVVCAGVPYGNGEDAFLGLFKAAWQTRPTLRVIGEGNNYIPMVHARDVARLTRHVIEVGPDLDYHLCVDRGDITQKAFIQAVARQYALPYDPKPVSVAEALMAELADILTMDVRLEPSPLMQAQVEAPVEKPAEAEEGAEGGEAAAEVAADASATLSQADGDAPVADELEEPDPSNQLPSFRWWSEKGLVANIDQVAAEFSRWRRLQPVRMCVVGPPGSGTMKLGEYLSDFYKVPMVNLEDLIEEQRNLETPLGAQVREQLEVINANMANPKSAGPFQLPAPLAVQLVEGALTAKPGAHRGFILAGFPGSVEEASSLFLEEEEGGAEVAAAPAGKKDAKKGAEEEPPEERKIKAHLALDCIAVVASSDEACLARAQAVPEKYVEKEHQVSLERWKKEGEALPEFFTARMALEPVTVSADVASEQAMAKHEAAVKAAEENEAEAPQAPEAADLVVLAAGSWAWLDHAAKAIVSSLESRRPVFNFMPSPASAIAAKLEVPAEEDVSGAYDAAAAEAAAAAAAAAEAAKKAEKLRAEEQQRVEKIKSDELARLEKHSEPLRMYLMNFVVPALTGALVDVCRVQPEDPAGYLAEYLAVYSEVSRERAAAQAASERERAAAAAEAKPA
eukprot:TRINITY_DN78085_c0_g1_i1.p1 TRINITY_DN78085_c0_g1~~TRINITY_DN78085_c0_g1_i1.p1  ORF type:complete len:860 (+),score=240.32 TRINITY_DN78085_c0_g1_i1:81-2582(+)